MFLLGHLSDVNLRSRLVTSISPLPRLFFLLGFFPKLLAEFVQQRLKNLQNRWRIQVASSFGIDFSTCITCTDSESANLNLLLCFLLLLWYDGLFRVLFPRHKPCTDHRVVRYCRGAPCFLHLQLRLHVLFEAWHALPSPEDFRSANVRD